MGWIELDNGIECSFNQSSSAQATESGHDQGVLIAPFDDTMSAVSGDDACVRYTYDIHDIPYDTVHQRAIIAASPSKCDKNDNIVF